MYNGIQHLNSVSIISSCKSSPCLPSVHVSCTSSPHSLLFKAMKREPSMVDTMPMAKRGLNPVLMTDINHQGDPGEAGDCNSHLLFLCHICYRLRYLC